MNSFAFQISKCQNINWQIYNDGWNADTKYRPVRPAHDFVRYTGHILRGGFLGFASHYLHLGLKSHGQERCLWWRSQKWIINQTVELIWIINLAKNVSLSFLASNALEWYLGKIFNLELNQGIFSAALLARKLCVAGCDTPQEWNEFSQRKWIHMDVGKTVEDVTKKIRSSVAHPS